MSAITQPAPRRVLTSRAIQLAGLEWLLIGALLIARLALSWVMISRPGLQQDETLFVNAATMRIPGENITHALGGIPLMIFPYTGALKAWLYAPVFSLFGTSPTTIRLPVVILTCAGLVLVYVAVRDLVNRPVALLAFAALCFDNSLFWLTRDDVGPSAIEFFLKCMALFLAVRFAWDRRLRWVVALLVVIALGVFNKLNFIWVANAAVVVSLLAVVLNRRAIRSNRRTLVVWTAGLAVVYACFAVYYLGDHIGQFVAKPSGSLTQPWAPFEQGMKAILSGTWFYNYALAPLSPRTVVVWIVIAFFAAGAVSSLALPRTRNLGVAAVALVTVVIAVQILFTPQATAGWHYISVYPFVTIVAAYGAYAAARLLWRPTVAVKIGIACIGTIALAYDGSLMARYFSDLSSREPSSSAWSPAIYQLDRDVQRLPGRVFTTDWGIPNPLFALHQSRRYTDLAFTLKGATAASLKQVATTLAAVPAPKLVVTHADDKQVFPQVNTNLFRAAGEHLHLLQTIRGRDGAPVFEMYTYR